MARRRGLSAEDKALWSRVAATAVPMHPARKKSAPVADMAKPSLTAKPAARDPLPLAGLSLGGKLSGGSTRIDLHGMTLAVAQPVLIRFVLQAQAAGKRLVLVITGKGREGGPDAPLPVRPGALRHNVPHWLHMPPLNAIVLQARPAHRRHGGEGAYYVYLRR